jgi:hypothetical protein
MKLRAFNILPGMVISLAGEQRLAVVETVRRNDRREIVELEGHLVQYYSVGRLVGAQKWNLQVSFCDHLHLVGATPQPWIWTEDDFGTLTGDVYADANNRVMECHEQMEVTATPVIHLPDDVPIVRLQDIMTEVKQSFLERTDTVG